MTNQFDAPFRFYAHIYYEKGWNPIPLPHRMKASPPVGFTGASGKFADENDIDDWYKIYKKGNLALRHGKCVTVEGRLYETLGIDVDDYGQKTGGAELLALEGKFGRLPDTWTSSARSDGVSGIRHFLVPPGFAYRGKASDSIEVIQRSHRYAIVFPSWNPDCDSIYRWYAPGVKPDGVNYVENDYVPNVSELAVLK